MDILTANDRIGAYPNSYYAATATAPAPFAPADGALRCDVCVVGGGFTGLSTALHLADRGYDVILLEAHRVGFGASGRNGGQVGTGQRLGQDTLEKLLGTDHAHALWHIGQEAVALVRTLVGRYDMDCGFAEGIIHADHRRRYVAHSHAYAEKLRTEYGYDKIRALDRDEIRHLVGSDAYFGGSLDLGGGHLHPLRLAFGLAKAAAGHGVRIFEQSRVTRIEPTDPAVVATEKAEITADYVVLGCNGYLGDLDRQVAAHVMPINNFIVATESLPERVATSLIRDNYAVADSKFVVNYFRLSEDRRLLFGGTESYGYRFPADIAALVRRPMLQIYPQLRDIRIDYAWGGTLGITMNRMPHFTRLRGNVISAGGYSGHGVGMATFAGSVVADAISGQAEKFDVMAGVPVPRFPGGATLRWPLLVLAMLWYSLRDRI